MADGFDGVGLIQATADFVVLDVHGVTRRFDVAVHGAHRYVDSSLGPVVLRRVERFADPAEQLAAGSLVAPMPGVVASVGVEVGDRVERGQTLLWLEAMKMQHQIDAPAAGVVTELPAATGQQVDVGTVLAVVDTEMRLDGTACVAESASHDRRNGRSRRERASASERAADNGLRGRGTQWRSDHGLHRDR